MQINTIHYKSSTNMAELKDNSIKLIITSPPYFNIKDYSQNKENYTTLKVAKELNKNYIGYEIYQQYKPLIEKKIS